MGNGPYFRRRILKSSLTIVTFLFFIFAACEDENGCSDCGGGLTGGYLYKKVTPSDLGQLGDVDEINLDSCIRYKLSGDEFDADNVAVVPDCCCDEYSIL